MPRFVWSDAHIALARGASLGRRGAEIRDPRAESSRCPPLSNLGSRLSALGGSARRAIGDASEIRPMHNTQYGARAGSHVRLLDQCIDGGLSGAPKVYTKLYKP